MTGLLCARFQALPGHINVVYYTYKMCTTVQFIAEGQAHSSQSIATIHTPGIGDRDAWQIFKGEKTRGLLGATSVRFFSRYSAGRHRLC